jgi:hypothetical protein
MWQVKIHFDHFRHIVWQIGQIGTSALQKEHIFPIKAPQSGTRPNKYMDHIAFRIVLRLWLNAENSQATH